MAQLNITLNQEEILQLLSADKNADFAKLLQDSLNSILKAESAEQLKAKRHNLHYWWNLNFHFRFANRMAFSSCIFGENVVYPDFYR